MPRARCPAFWAVSCKLLILLSLTGRSRFRHVRCKSTETLFSKRTQGRCRPAIRHSCQPGDRPISSLIFLSFFPFSGVDPHKSNRTQGTSPLRPPAERPGDALPFAPARGKSYNTPLRASLRSGIAAGSRPAPRRPFPERSGMGVAVKGKHDEKCNGEVPTSQLDPTQERSSRSQPLLNTYLIPLCKG